MTFSDLANSDEKHEIKLKELSDPIQNFETIPDEESEAEKYALIPEEFFEVGWHCGNGTKFSLDVFRAKIRDELHEVYALQKANF